MSSESELTYEEALEVANNALGEKLKDLEADVFRLSWQGKGKRYEEIAKEKGYSHGHVRNIGNQLWDKLTKALGEPVSKKNFREALKREFLKSKQQVSTTEIEFPEGVVPLESEFYVERSPIESNCYQEILKPGALIRIKAPQQMGKTSLLSKILAKGQEKGCQTLRIDFQEADNTVLSELRNFLTWFCVYVSDGLELPNRVAESWQELGGVPRNCTRYIQKHVLAKIETDLVLGLDNLDLVFEQEAISNDFCQLLRSWNDQAKVSDRIGNIWKKMRLVLVHSTEVYRKMDINSSPLAGVGFIVPLREFNQKEVEEFDRNYGFNWGEDKLKKLREIIGGNPALLQLFCDGFNKDKNVKFEQLLETAPTEEGVFGNHLRRHLRNLRQNEDLASGYYSCVTSQEPVELDSTIAFKLHRMGLVKFQRNSVIPRCEIYRQYFSNRLKS